MVASFHVHDFDSLFLTLHLVFVISGKAFAMLQDTVVNIRRSRSVRRSCPDMGVSLSSPGMTRLCSTWEKLASLRACPCVRTLPSARLKTMNAFGTVRALNFCCRHRRHFSCLSRQLSQCHGSDVLVWIFVASTLCAFSYCG